jgi:hypothetical protein
MEHEGSLPCSQNPPLVPTLSQMNQVHTFQLYFPTIYSSIILPSMPSSSEWSHPIRFPEQNCVRMSHLSHVCHMLRPSHPPCLDNPNNIWWIVRVMKLLIMQYIDCQDKVKVKGKVVPVL